MSKWDGCRVIACKNKLCDLECQYLKRLKDETRANAETRDVATQFATQFVVRSHDRVLFTDGTTSSSP
jgi:hypothetical protein